MDKQILNSKAAATSTLGENLQSVFVITAIPIILILSFLFYIYVLGDPSHFQGGDPHNHPISGDYFGIIYKGGYIVPVLISLIVMVITFSVERMLTISQATGKGSLLKFIKNIREYVNFGQVEEAIAACDKQKGSVANVVKAGLLKYKEMGDAQHMDQEKKILAIQKDIEETTQLELPMLEKNLVIIATIASISTLIGLLGTVLGMIKAFAALATAGAPDAVALANGISEALINTALGILGSAFAIIAYNYFTSKIDSLTYNIDEAGYSIIQNFAAKDIGSQNIAI
ncbi:MAG TPA: MotA/TolQ/ExbB proton channel family protein [Arenibacter sp.]|nr:MotA/TolQ/ExbB proton channel family protein [Arenibacter sp.]